MCVNGSNGCPVCNGENTDECTVVELIELVDSHHGCYAPQYFAQQYGADVVNVDADAIDVLLCGPGSEEYWECWEHVVDNGLLHYGGYVYAIYQDGDVWAYRSK